MELGLGLGLLAVALALTLTLTWDLARSSFAAKASASYVPAGCGLG